MKEIPSRLPRLTSLFHFALGAFAFTSVASIALQNFIWAAVALWLFLQFKKGQKFNLPRGPFSLAALLFLFSFFFAAIIGLDPANSFNTVHKYLTMLLFFFVGAMPLLFKDIQRLLSLLNYGAAICALHGIGKHFWDHQDRIDSFSGDKMVFGGMLMVCLLFQIYFLRNGRNSWFQWMILGLLGFGLLLTSTRGAWIGFVAGSALLAWNYNRKWLLIAGLSLVPIFLLLPHSIQERVGSIGTLNISYNEKHEIDNASQTRLLIWISGWKIIQHHPWGVGQGNVSEVYPQYRLGALDRVEPNLPHLHNNYLQILAQNGWEGLACYLFWIVSYYFAAIGQKPEDPDGADLNWAFLCVFSAVLVWGLTEYTFSHQFMNLQFFLLGLQANLWAKGKRK